MGGVFFSLTNNILIKLYNIMVIYKTTNLINGKFYIGKDIKNNPNYYGSGVILKKAIKKYGKNNFIKEIIEVCNNAEELANREIYWISKLNAHNKKIAYNIGIGGFGGDNITFNPNKKQFIAKMKIINSKENNGMFGKNHSEESRLLQKQKANKRYSKEWFCERYGEIDGEIKYNERNSKISKDRIGFLNPVYIHVEKDDIIKFIKDNPDCKLYELVKYIGVGSTCMYNKFKLYFSCKNLNEIKSLLL